MKKKTITEIKKALPNIQSQKVEDFADALDNVLVIKRIFQSEDGKILIEELRDSCGILITKLINTYKNKPELNELLGLIAALDANLKLLTKVQDISLEKELREQLDEAVKEAYN